MKGWKGEGMEGWRGEGWRGEGVEGWRGGGEEKRAIPHYPRRAAGDFANSTWSEAKMRYTLITFL